MVKEGKMPFVYKNRPARIGVLPRYAKSGDEVRWFTSERWMCFHTAAAWEEGSKIRLYLCTMRDFRWPDSKGMNATSLAGCLRSPPCTNNSIRAIMATSFAIERHVFCCSYSASPFRLSPYTYTVCVPWLLCSLDAFTATEDAEPYMSEVILDLEDGSCSFRRLPGATPGDFPVIPAHLVGAWWQLKPNVSCCMP